MVSNKQLPLLPINGEAVLSQHSTIEAAVAPFLEHLRQDGRSQHTIKAFASDMRLVVEFFGAEMILDDFTTTKLNRFMTWIETGRGVSCSRKTYARRVTTLKVFFKFLRETNVLADNPADALLQRSGAAPLQPALTDEQVDRLLEQTALLRLAEEPDARPDLLLRLLLDTGIKKSECMRLTPADITREDPTNPVLIVRHKQPDKVYKERKIVLDPDWLNVLDEYLAQYTPQKALFDCTSRNLEYILRDVADLAGVEGKVSFEILRWTSAVRDYRRGIDLEDLRDKMGLSRISWRETSDKIVRLATLQNHQE